MSYIGQKLKESYVDEITQFIDNLGNRTDYLNIISIDTAIYLKQNKSNRFKVYSLTASEEIDEYSRLWKEYLDKFNKAYSKFDKRTKKGFWDTFLPLPKKSYNFTKINKEIRFSIEEDDEKDEFIEVDKGWESFIRNKYTEDKLFKKDTFYYCKVYIHDSKHIINNENWYIACYILLDYESSKLDHNVLYTLINEQVSKLLISISINLHELLITDKQTVIQIKSLRLAITKILSRSSSHNLGSHVIESTLSGPAISDPVSKKLLRYIKERMEYISIGGVNVFNEICDIKTIIDKFENNSLLKLYISGKSSISKDNIKFKINDTNKQLSIPNGNLGYHSLYIILENIIRNCTKHNYTFPYVNGNILLSYQIIIVDSDVYKNYYEVKIVDNFSEIYSQISNATNTDYLLKLKTDIWRILDDNIIHDGNIRTNGWGILEMKIAACILAGIPIDNLLNSDSDNYNYPTILDVGIQEGNLYYKFYIQKPKIAIIEDIKNIGNDFDGIQFIEGFDNNMQKFGTEHEFAIFTTKKNDVLTHEEKTNQRSILVNPSEITDLLNLDLNSLIGRLYFKYIESKFKIKDYNIICPIDENDLIDKISDNKKNIILDNHISSFGFISSNKIAYYQGISTKAKGSANLREQYILDKGSERIICKIIEMANTSIVVLDERIQKLLNDLPKDNGWNPIHSRVFIPNIEDADLDICDSDDIINWYNKLGIKEKIDYLIIHRSLKSEERIILNKINVELKPKKIIYVSGGGIPPNITDNFYYLPYDTLYNCIGIKMEFDKYSFVNILKQLRQLRQNE